MYKVAAQVKTQHCEPVYSKSFYFLRRASGALGSNFHTYLGWRQVKVYSLKSQNRCTARLRNKQEICRFLQLKFSLAS